MSENTAQYRVESLAGLYIIINHFDKYPLITKKQADYKLFKLALNLIKNKNLKKNAIFEYNLIKIYLHELQEYKWSVNKDIIIKEIMFNQYFIS